MLTVTANMLRTKGISSFSEVLNDNEEAIISVHGKNKFVVLSMEKYNYLRECELEAALLEAKEDLKNVCFCDFIMIVCYCTLIM